MDSLLSRRGEGTGRYAPGTLCMHAHAARGFVARCKSWECRAAAEIRDTERVAVRLPIAERGRRVLRNDSRLCKDHPVILSLRVFIFARQPRFYDDGNVNVPPFDGIATANLFYTIVSGNSRRKRRGGDQARCSSR